MGDRFAECWKWKQFSRMLWKVLWTGLLQHPKITPELHQHILYTNNMIYTYIYIYVLYLNVYNIYYIYVVKLNQIL